MNLKEWCIEVNRLADKYVADPMDIIAGCLFCHRATVEEGAKLLVQNTPTTYTESRALDNSSEYFPDKQH